MSERGIEMSERIISAIKLGAQQLAAVVTLPGSDRYEYFVKRVADSQEVWGLYQDGWALAKTDDGTLVFPMWPASDYASLCAEFEWDGYDAQSFSVEELLDDLLPQLEQDRVLPGIFYTPGDKGITPTVAQLREDLAYELGKY
ncbi:DUF2750 domain-containing protein [Massilia niastensis]|uniref:DUF2750 domain-containing protein n=1 Tax=Massilia niastensis TaxID=544911 RepID=UPI00035EAA75|nr:DUF2750 domain-containing protein [Massilia niastensis]